MKSFDFFRKVDQEIQSTTSSGGVFSILAAICGIVLVINEWKEYRKFELSHTMFVDHDFDGDFRVNMNITFLNAPCQIIGVGSEDELGQSNLHMNKNLTYTRVDKNDKILPHIDFDNSTYVNTKSEVDDLATALQNGEKCNVAGTFEVKKTPGNFNFGFRQKQSLVSRLSGQNRDLYRKINVDHTIQHLYFGNLEIDNFYYQSYKLAWFFKRKFSYLNVYGIEDKAIDPYEGLTFKQEGKYQFENHLSLLPVTLGELKRFKQVQEVYQYNIYSGGLQKGIDEIPTAYYRYKMNPVNIKYYQKMKSRYHFIVQLLAIVGGIFAVIGIAYKVVSTVSDGIKSQLKQSQQTSSTQ